MKTLTVFTPTYNRKHTLPRTYGSLCRQTCTDFDWLVIDDGSSDGTREWITSLGEKIVSSGQRFDWMGRVEGGEDDNHFVIQAPNVRIEYVYKPNGGLYTGYNVAYQTIQTELCVCIDSDDYMPDDAVEKIVKKWSGVREEEKKKYCGILGLDFDLSKKSPIGGYMPTDLYEGNFIEMDEKNIHRGDSKLVFRTDLMKEVAPLLGFSGEKNFNPQYLAVKVGDKYPVLILNENLCWVEYQIGTDSMSAGIINQYFNSPRSFAKMRLQEMELCHFSFKHKFRSAIHYVCESFIARDGSWLTNANSKTLVFLAAPLGLLLYFYLVTKRNRLNKR